MKTDKPIQILIADDSPFIRTAYRRILETQDNFNVVAVAEDGQEALERAMELKPDVIVMDVRMPRLDGISASLKIRETLPDTSVVVVSAYDDWSYVFDLIGEEPEGKAYLLKNSLDDIGELIRAVELVNERHLVLDPALVSRLGEYYERHIDGEIGSLDGREVDILSLLAEGYKDGDMSEELQISEEEVLETLNSIYQKLGVEVANGMNMQVQATLAFLNRCVSV